MRPWLTMSRKHSRSLDDHNPGGELYERHQAPAPEGDPPPPEPPPTPDPPPSDDEPEEIDPEKHKGLVEHNRRLKKQFNDLMGTHAKTLKENEALKKVQDAADKAKLSEVERLRAENQEKDQKLAEKDAEIVRKDCLVMLANHQVDPEYQDEIGAKLAKAMKADGFKAKDWFESLKAKKPALFVGEQTHTTATAGGTAAAGGGGEVAELSKRIESMIGKISMLNQEDQMELTYLISKRNALQAK